MPNFEIEKSIIIQQGNLMIAGVDEVGRGPLAGPLVAAAVVFTKYDEIIPQLTEVNDSKKLTPKKRELLDRIIRNTATDYAIGEVSVDEIDTLGISKANSLAFMRAVDNLKKCQYCLIDGLPVKEFEYNHQCIIRGDSQSISIAAASIIAKVYRDNLMVELHKAYPAYGFDSNKGYGSAHHMEVLKQIGPSPYHRKSFLGFLKQTSRPRS